MMLPEFLLARTAEDEAAARALPLWPEDAAVSTRSLAVNEYLQRVLPARMLAECEAKRRIVGHESYDRPKLGAPPYNGPLNDPDNPGQRHPQLVAYIASHGERVADTAILRCLALPYADHPDYREEWRP